MYDGTITIGAELSTENYEAQIEQMLDKIEDLENQLQAFEPDTKEWQEVNSELEKTRNKLIKLVDKQKQLNQPSNAFNESLDKTSDKISRVITKMGKWALAVFSIRSAYNLVRQSVSTLQEYDGQMAADIQYMQYALATGLAPIIKGIVNLMNYLLGLVNAISIAFFNYNLFSEATAKNLKKANGSAKDLKKTLTGFDEMNILSDTGATASGGGIIGDFEKSENNLKNATTKMQEYIGKVKTNYQEMVDYVNKPGLFQQAYGVWGMFVNGVVREVVGIGQIFKGIIDIVKGVFDIIVGTFTGNEEQLSKGWRTFVSGLGSFFTGIFNSMVGFLEITIGTIKGIFGSIFTWINDHIIQPIKTPLSNMWDGLSTGASKAWNGVKNVFNGVGSFFTGIKNTISSIFTTIGTKVGEVVGGAFKSVINGVISMVENKINSFISTMNTLIKAANKIPGVNLSKVASVSLPRLAVGGVVNMPGRGINYGGANIGERGAEGVIPLTNSEMMAQLGEAIGRYITINASITNTMNGRVISRELQKVNNSNDFATNR